MEESSFTEKDRKVLYDVRDQVEEINGTVKRHDEEIFGSNTKSTKGLVTGYEQLHDFEVAIRTGIKVIITLLSILGITNIVLLFRLGG